jgi:DNA invertase Pin-like site-specific DNA recombinase
MYARIGHMSSPDTESPRRSKVIAYLRVSTRSQAEDGIGLRAQEMEIREWCKERGHRVVGVFSDEGVSGTLDVADRPGLGQALMTVEDCADALVVWRYDRLARKLVIQETIIERLSRFDRLVLSVCEPDLEGDDGTRIMVRQIVGAVVQYERALMLARMSAARKAKHEAGQYAGYGSPPYGWVATRDGLQQIESEQATIRRIVHLRASGRSLREIAEALTTEGLHPKRGGSWHPTVIRRIVSRADHLLEQQTSAEIRQAEAMAASTEAAQLRSA